MYCLEHTKCDEGCLRVDRALLTRLVTEERIRAVLERREVTDKPDQTDH